MQVTERKPRNVAAGIGWLVLALLMVGGLALSLFLGPVGLLGALFFGLCLFASGVKAWAAFTGAKRVGSTPPSPAAASPAPAPR